MKIYKNLNVKEELHTALKVRAAKNQRTIIDELEQILKEALEDELNG